MKTTLAALLLLFFVAGRLVASSQIYPVSAATLPSWQIGGTTLAAIQTDPSLSLPAGAELTRAFSGGAVLLHSTSNPAFTDLAQDWPVLEVGPASLAFVRQGDAGKIVLVVGGTATTLAGSVPLNASGQSVQPVDIVLGYDPLSGVGVVIFGDQAQAFSGTTAGTPVAVVVSAGSLSAWAQSSLDVLVIAPDSVDSSSASTATTPDTANSGVLAAAIEKMVQAGNSARAAGKVVAGAAGAGATAGPAAGAGHLQIFSPPAARHTVNLVRSIVAKSLQP